MHTFITTITLQNIFSLGLGYCLSTYYPTTFIIKNLNYISAGGVGTLFYENASQSIKPRKDDFINHLLVQNYIFTSGKSKIHIHNHNKFIAQIITVLHFFILILLLEENILVILLPTYT